MTFENQTTVGIWLTNIWIRETSEKQTFPCSLFRCRLIVHYSSHDLNTKLKVGFLSHQSRNLSATAGFTNHSNQVLKCWLLSNSPIFKYPLNCKIELQIKIVTKISSGLRKVIECKNAESCSWAGIHQSKKLRYQIQRCRMVNPNPQKVDMTEVTNFISWAHLKL